MPHCDNSSNSEPNVPFIYSNMDLSRLEPTLSARLHIGDVPQVVAAPASSAAAASGVAPWEQTLAAQCAAQTNTSAAPTPSASIQPTNFRTQALQAGESSTALPPRLQPAFAAQLRVSEILQRAQADPASNATTAVAKAATPAATPTPAVATNSSLDNVKILPLDQIAQQESLLNRADVRVDPSTNLWRAEWPSPSPFNYGMVLKPTLAKFIKDGQSFSFQNGSDQVQTITNKGGQIYLGQTGGETILDSQGLKHLLQDKIKASGYELYLTQRGSLVLTSTHAMAPALTMAQ